MAAQASWGRGGCACVCKRPGLDACCVHTRVCPCAHMPVYVCGSRAAGGQGAAAGLGSQARGIWGSWLAGAGGIGVVWGPAAPGSRLRFRCLLAHPGLAHIFVASDECLRLRMLPAGKAMCPAALEMFLQDFRRCLPLDNMCILQAWLVRTCEWLVGPSYGHDARSCAVRTRVFSASDPEARDL